MADGVRERHVVVVGAGIGGLVAALLLACRGLRVTVLERAPTPGGKMRQVWVGGAPIDSGPTVFTMRWIFEEIFGAAGSSLEANLRLTPLEILARHVWHDGARLDLHADPQRSAEAIGAFAGGDEARRFLRFCAKAAEIYATLEAPYIRSAKPTFFEMVGRLGPHGLATLASVGPFATLWFALSRRFRDPRLRQLFGRYATYCGSSPWAAPATLMLVAKVEMDGVWSVDGGIHEVARALAALAVRRGVAFRYGTACDGIEVRDGRAAGVRLEGGERLAADAIVFNGDATALARGLLGAAAMPAVRAVAPRERSLSALTWSIRAAARGFPLAHHNVFFDGDYASELRDIFRLRRLPRRATVYVCAQDRTEGAPPPQGAERLFALVNAPAVGDTDHLDRAEIDACEQACFALVNRCGLQVDRCEENTVRTTPADFERLFPASGGALYGRATHGWMALFKRPSSASALPGLYLAGGTVHPGPGMPMAAMSGRLAAATLMAHLDSISRSHRAATSGGTSTPSATTAGTG